uniref:Uncharacterized protein n=1 Tax=Schizaphis graminum TaxID=13262 RepID=A0A2S2NQV7_SCHGA
MVEIRFFCKKKKFPGGGRVPYCWRTPLNIIHMLIDVIILLFYFQVASMIEEIEVEENKMMEEIEVEEKVDEIEVDEIEVEENKVNEIKIEENKVIYDVPSFEENLPGPSVTDSARMVNKRKFYIGDFKSENDIESPNSRRKLFHAAQTSHKKYQSTVRKLRMQNHNLKKKILNLGQLIDHLKCDNKINESCFSFLNLFTVK